VNLRAAFTVPSGHFELAGWVYDLTNERNRISTLDGFLNGYIATQAELDAGYYAIQKLLTKPRTWGVTDSFRF
jgi:hypothetical protein